MGHSLSWREFNWETGPFIIAYHLGLLVGLPLYFYYNTVQLSTVVAALVLLFVSEIGIGAAYHRFYSHRSFELSKPAEGLLLLLATIAVQGPIYRWAYEHRLHHTFVDTDKDPYSIHKGFWYAHMLWLFEKSKPIESKWVRDLEKNGLVMFQHRNFLLISTLVNIIICGAIGWALNDFLGAFVLVWWTRLAIGHHLTWFINSAAHYWGTRTYSKEHSAVDNYAVALLTVGEGYHNFHHTFPRDYRNGIRWYHFDPTKWTIWTFSKLGLAQNLKRTSAYRIKQRLLQEDRRMLLEKVSAESGRAKAELERRILQLSDALTQKLEQLSALAERVREYRSQRDKSALRATRQQLRSLRRSMSQDWKAWYRLCEAVL